MKALGMPSGHNWKLLGNQWTDPESTYMVHSARTRRRLSERDIWVGLTLQAYGIDAPTMPWWIFDLNGHYETLNPPAQLKMLGPGKKQCLLWKLVQKLKAWRAQTVVVHEKWSKHPSGYVQETTCNGKVLARRYHEQLPWYFYPAPTEWPWEQNHRAAPPNFVPWKEQE